MGPSREFFAVRTVADALAGFRPPHRTALEVVALGDALGRIPGEPVLAPSDLPGFARSTVDGYAVRAADTYGASEGLPGYLELAGEVAMGVPPTVDVVPAAPWRFPPAPHCRWVLTPSSWSSTRSPG
jgi:molybdopterin molybdotransferase